MRLVGTGVPLSPHRQESRTPVGVGHCAPTFPEVDSSHSPGKASYSAQTGQVLLGLTEGPPQYGALYPLWGWPRKGRVHPAVAQGIFC